MNKLRKGILRRFIIALVMILPLILGAAHAAEGALVVDGVPIVSGFQPGYGSPVGHVQTVKGRAVIIHKQGTEGYFAKPQLGLYQGDKIITRGDGHIRMALNDDSVMVLAPDTSLVIDQSVYDPDRQTRSSFVDMVRGKTWFLIKKLGTFKRSEFKVRTQTAIAGVRGSEFIILAAEDRSVITAVKDTRLEVAFLAAPEVPPVMITDLEQTVVLRGARTAPVVSISLEQLREITTDFFISPREKVSEIKDTAKDVKERSIRVSPADLLPPEALVKVPEAMKVRRIDYSVDDTPSELIERIRDEDILEKVKAEVREELRETRFHEGVLPDFPQQPE